MNFKEIIGPDELDWKVIPLDWEKIGKDELKLGTPMSRDGVEANDASCYGILMDDVQKDKHFQARVIVSGCVDFAKAEEYSGIKISAEAKKAIGKVWSQGGGASSWNDLTDKPFGKEQGEVTLTFNPAVNTEAYGPLRKISDTALPLSGLIGAKVKILYNGEERSVVVKESDITSGAGYDTVAVFAEGFAGTQFMSVYEAQTEADFGMDVPVGVYVAYSNESNPYVAEINATTKTIHRIDPEYLPEGYPYRGEIETVALLAEQSMVFSNGETSLNYADFSNIFAGDTIKISFDGVEYTCKAKTAFGGGVGVGNASIWDGDDTGEPFLIAVLTSGEALLVTSAEGDTHTVGIYKQSQTIHPMSPEYLPRMVVNLVRQDDGELSCDKTFAEIKAGVNSGAIVEVHLCWSGPQETEVLYYAGNDFTGDLVFANIHKPSYNSNDMQGFYVTFGQDETPEGTFDCKRFTFPVTWVQF